MPDNAKQELEDFKARMESFKSLSKEEQMRRLRGIGLYGPDGGLTTRFGGDSPLDLKAMKARQRELAGL